MVGKVNRMDEYGRCITCGERHLICTTEQKGNKWVWKRRCSFCNDLKEIQFF